MQQGKYHIHTFGCQMNDHDSEILAGMLEELNYTSTNILEEADLIILNTCCVRESAENKVYGRIGELKKLKHQRPDLLIGICGCMTQQEEMAEKIKNRAPHVDLIFGTHNLHQLPDLIEQAKNSKETIIDVWESEGAVIEALPHKREGGLKAWVTIMYGCNNFCSYCIVPYVRGRERSRAAADIKAEVEELGRLGYKEITLLGQNVNSYGKDLDPVMDFADLLQVLDPIPGIDRFRYMTSHPRDFTDKLIDVIANSKKVCEHFHLPFQAGSNRILKAMNRGYTKEYYLELVKKIRTRVPEASITADIIVGFPGETEEDFEQTLEVLQEAQLDAAFTFVYSKRSGTPAAEMANQISADDKKKRITSLIALQHDISLKRNKADEGKIMEVLVEGESKNDPEKLGGRTRTNKIVAFQGTNDLIGKVIPVRIMEGKTWHLEGNIKNL